MPNVTVSDKEVTAANSWAELGQRTAFSPPRHQPRHQLRHLATNCVWQLIMLTYAYQRTSACGALTRLSRAGHICFR